jgi:hypothetical protein
MRKFERGDKKIKMLQLDENMGKTIKCTMEPANKAAIMMERYAGG